ncbi:MAG TPA: amidohydrolase family protein [Acidobacteriaceae bacterium]|nr:amidohydrolase family protein [Acidobacteriaceae bacterium]
MIPATLLDVKRILLFAVLTTATSLLVQAQQAVQHVDQKPAADIIYFHGNILTGDGLNTDHPKRVSALAERDGVILAVGSDKAILQTWAGAKTERVDLAGAFVVPGLNDAHVHLAAAGEEKLSVELLGSKSLQEMLDRIQKAAQAAAPGTWLQGGGWDHTLWANKILPTRADLDAVTEGHPAIFYRVDGHIAVVNSAALAAAGITDQTADPQGGKFDHDASGHLTGIVREDPAADLIEKKIPEPTQAERKKALLLALNEAVCGGLTSVQDYSPGWENFMAMESLEHSQQLPIRVSEWLSFKDPLNMLEQERGSHPKADRMLTTAMLKGFMDGSLGSRTAAMLAPYSDDPTNSGIPRYTQDKLNAMTVARARAGFQIGFHAIGDRANQMALDAFAAAEAANPAAKQLRFRIEHAQVVSPGDFERFHQLGVIASMQPSHLLSDMRWAQARLGPERVPYSYAWKSFLDHDVVLAFGTDYPVEPIAPYRGLYEAVTRMNEAGTMSYDPSEKLTMGEALYAYTQGSAYAQFDEQWKGRLAPGYVADFTVLDRDLTKIAPHAILDTKVLRTVVNGKTAACVATQP